MPVPSPAPIIHLTPRQLDNLAEKIASKLADKMLSAQDEMISLEQLIKETGLSRSFIYSNADILGGVKVAGKWRFSRRNVEAVLRSGVA